jgi:hypothetical protein
MDEAVSIYCFGRTERLGRRSGRAPDEAKRTTDPPSSTDIAAAWPLVERYKMTVAPPLPITRPLWEAYPFGMDHRDWLGAGDTAPLAICRAALKAAAIAAGGGR